MMENKIKSLTLDYSKWRCGEDGPNKLGEGKTLLLNKQGFMCCLGLFSSQMGIPPECLQGNGEPLEVTKQIPLLNKWEDDIDYEVNVCRNTDLSLDCIGINDKVSTTPEEKISELADRLKKEDIELIVINKP